MRSVEAKATASVRADDAWQKEKSKRFVARLSLTIIEALEMAVWMSIYRLADLDVNPRCGEPSSPRSPPSPLSHPPQHGCGRGAAHSIGSTVNTTSTRLISGSTWPLSLKESKSVP